MKVAKRYMQYKLIERTEDHEGGIVKRQNGQKLSEDYDLTWHDVPVTADFLSRLLPFQKVNQFPGIYQITKKNYLARNLMKMKKSFPKAYNFFPRTWVLPSDGGEFRNDNTN